jgi:hypothetical protein
MRKLALVISLSAIFFLQSGGSIGDWGSGKAYGKSLKEKTLNVDGSTIQVKTFGALDVVKVKAKVKVKKGKKKGRLTCKVTIKNTGDKPQQYRIYCQGRKKSGGWEGGSVKKFPKKGNLEPGEQKTAKVKTGFKAKATPKEVRVEVFKLK